MRLEKIEPKGAGRFLRSYDLCYTMQNGAEKRYEMVSRTPIATAADIPGGAADGVVLIVLNPDKTKVLLNKEFRPAVNGYVYNFPAGLSEPGESAQQTAARELWEETGLQMLQCLGVYGKSYGAVGLSNETAMVLFCTADDTEPFGGNHDPAEEITPLWVDKAGAEAIAQGGAVTARVQLFLALWGMNALGE